MGNRIRVLIADDQAISREGIQRILERENDIEIVGVLETAPEVLPQAREKKPDVVLLDLRWYHDDQAMNDVITLLRRERPKTCIICMTVYDHLVQPAKDAGAKYVITKDIGKNELLRYVRTAYAESVQEAEAIPDTVNLPCSELARLRQNLVDSFSEEELRTLCFELGVGYEALPAVGKDGKARELVVCIERRGLISEFITICRNQRPNVSWGDMWEATKERTATSPIG